MLTDEHKKAIKGVLGEISNSMTRTEAERDYINTAIKDLSDKYQIPKKVVRAMAKVHHKQNLPEVISYNEEVTETYGSIITSNKTKDTL